MLNLLPNCLVKVKGDIVPIIDNYGAKKCVQVYIEKTREFKIVPYRKLTLIPLDKPDELVPLIHGDIKLNNKIDNNKYEFYYGKYIITLEGNYLNRGEWNLIIEELNHGKLLDCYVTFLHELQIYIKLTVL